MANSKVALLRYIKIARGWWRVRVDAIAGVGAPKYPMLTTDDVRMKLSC